jgi:hypothetical protein
MSIKLNFYKKDQIYFFPSSLLSFYLRAQKTHSTICFSFRIYDIGWRKIVFHKICCLPSQFQLTAFPSLRASSFLYDAIKILLLSSSCLRPLNVAMSIMAREQFLFIISFLAVKRMTK